MWRANDQSLSESEVEEIRETIRVFGGLSRKELAGTLCEHLGWYSATGGYRLTACLRLMEQMESAGLVHLPAKRKRNLAATNSVHAVTVLPQREVVVEGAVDTVGPITVELVTNRADRLLWEAEVDRYHWLGYRKPFGCQLRYVIKCDAQRWGCLLFSGAAKALKVRDQWIGWGREQRQRNLGWVVNNSRLVIFPYIRVKNLASTILGHVARRLSDDWHDQWGYRPLLLETFVDPEYHRGTCYKASNWAYLGLTTGRGLARSGCHYQSTPKMIFVKPLNKQFRTLLCSDRLIGHKDDSDD